MSVDDRLQELGIVLGYPLPPVGNYIGAVTVGNLVFPRETDGPVEGKVGETLTLEQGRQAARNAACQSTSGFPGS